jgi:hypothetical protein
MCLCGDAPAGRLYDEQGRGSPGIEVGGLGNLSVGESEGGAGVQDTCRADGSRGGLQGLALRHEPVGAQQEGGLVGRRGGLKGTAAEHGSPRE